MKKTTNRLIKGQGINQKQGIICDWKVATRDASGTPRPLTEKQVEYYKESQNHTYNCMTGGWGAAKTYGGLYPIAVEVYQLFTGVWDTDHFDILFAHKTAQRCQETLLEHFFKILPRYLYDQNNNIYAEVCDTNFSDGKITYYSDRVFPNRPPRYARIKFMGLAEETGQINMLMDSGANYDLMCATQIEKFPERAWWAMWSRLGRREIKALDGGKDFKPRMYLDRNPAKDWSYRRFIKGEIGADEHYSDYYFLRVGTKDNPYLSQSYAKRIEALPPVLKRKYYDGFDDSGEGMVYETFDEKIHVFQERDLPFKESWAIKRSMDYGIMADPIFVCWYVLDHDGNIFFIDEMEEYNHTGRMAVDKIRQKDGILAERFSAKFGVKMEVVINQISGLYAPTDMKKTESGGKSIGWQFLRDPNDNSWRGINIEIVSIKGIGKFGKEHSVISMVLELLRVDPDHINPFTGEKGSPRLFISENCARLRQQIAEAEFNPEKDKREKPRIHNHHALNPSATHHYDGLDALELGVQQFRNPKGKEIKQKPLTDWQLYGYEKAFTQKRNRNF